MKYVAQWGGVRLGIFSAIEQVNEAMEITEVEIVPCDKGRLRAHVNITVDHCFLISDLKLIRNKKGYLVAMPARRRADGKYLDIIYPINTKTGK